MKMFVFWFIFCLFLHPIDKISIGSIYCLAPNMRKAIIWTYDNLVY